MQIPEVVNGNIQLFDGFIAIYKGLPNLLNNCWLNSCIVTVRFTIGGSYLCEEIRDHDIAPEDGYCSDFKPLIHSLGLGSTSTVRSGAELQQSLDNFACSEDLGQQDDPLRFFLHSAAAINQNSSEVVGSIPIYEVRIRSMYTCITGGQHRCSYKKH